MSYVRKLGASALVIAAAFAVAFAVLVSSVEADLVEPPETAGNTYTARDADAGPASNGDTIYVQHDNTGAGSYTTFTITTIGGASASFTHSSASDDGQSITCGVAAEAGTCDVDTAHDGITVALKIDDDSGAGTIFVNQKAVTTANDADEDTDAIAVTVAQVPTSLSVKAKSTSIDAKGAGPAGTTYVDIRLTDENGKGIEGASLTIVSTRALLSPVTTGTGSVGGDNYVAQTSTRTFTVGAATSATLDLTSSSIPAGTSASLAGTVMTSADADDDANDTDNVIDTSGYARVVVTGGGSPGVSTITVTVGDVSGTEEVVLHGPVASISAEIEEGAIEVGGETFIVVTALDKGGNPVANQNINVKTKGGNTPPEKLAVKVSTSNVVNKDGGTKGALTDKGDLPACGKVDATAAAAATEQDAAVVGVAASAGTNDAGQCVIEVSAPGGGTPTTTDDAARGTHTIIVVASLTGADGPKGVNEATVEIQVGGAPATIETDAPERIDPSAEVTVNVTVLDDEGVRVGRVNIEVIHTAGDGAVITDIAAKTKDGKASFTYLAPSTPGVTEFLVRTKNEAETVVTSQQAIIVQIAEAMADEPEVVEPDEGEEAMPDEGEEAMPDEPDVMVDPTLNPAPAGSVTIANFTGGSVEQLVAAMACESGAAAYVSVDGGWLGYIPGAPAPVNAAFVNNFTDGIPAGQGFVITNCGG